MRSSRQLAVLLALCLLATPAVWADGSGAVEDLLAQAEALLWLGVAENGAIRPIEEARALTEAASALLEEGSLDPVEQGRLSRQVEAVAAEIDLVAEVWGERYYGVFPLARLVVPALSSGHTPALTEEMFDPPDEAAVERAARQSLDLLGEYPHPLFVLGSSPTDHKLENVVSEVFVHSGRAAPVTRRVLIDSLNRTDLAAFDAGAIDEALVGRLMGELDAANLLVLTIGQTARLDRVQVMSLRGDYFRPDEEGTVVRDESFRFLGAARDRRDQFLPILVTQALMLALALAWAVGVPWPSGATVSPGRKLAGGAALFLFGRIFMIVAVGLLGRVAPEPDALVVEAWWWPALFGLAVIPAGGLLAWLTQARLTEILPGARGARAVGSVFALVTLGATSYTVAPLLQLDGNRGFTNLVPLVVASASLALLFGFAARTGPPVPHYFMLGPLVVAPLVGVSLLMASPAHVWATTGLAALLCLIAWIRHRLAVARGTEEDERSAEEAAASDRDKLLELGRRLTRKR